MSESNRFIKFIPSDEAMYLLKKKGHAFRLLTIIAESARRYEGGADGLKPGEALIGGHEEYDMSEQNYRTSKNILIRRQHIEIIETCRTRKKVTTGVTTVGTRVKLLSSTVYDINSDMSNDRTNDLLTTDQRPTNDELRKIRMIRKKEDNINIARSAARPRSKDFLSFDFEKWEFIGITEKDLADWKIMYPHVDISSEILKSANWIKSNPSKSNKKHWRKYITGWLSRSNESIENKKAFQNVSKANNQDRITKDINGKPVENQYAGMF